MQGQGQREGEGEMTEVWVKHHTLGAVIMSREQIDGLRLNGVPVEECDGPGWEQKVIVEPAKTQAVTYSPATEAPAKKRPGRPRKQRA